MDFNFSQISAALRLVHHIDDSHKKTFEARIKHFQRIGFPKGINTGKGRAAKYQWEHVLMISLALQLTELGLTPEKIVNRISPYTDLLIASFVEALGSGELPDGELQRWCFIVAMTELDQFRDSATGIPPIDFLREDHIIPRLKTFTRVLPIALIDATHLVTEVIACISLSEEIPIPEIVEDLTELADRYATISQVQEKLDLL